MRYDRQRPDRWVRKGAALTNLWRLNSVFVLWINGREASDDAAERTGSFFSAFSSEPQAGLRSVTDRYTLRRYGIEHSRLENYCSLLRPSAARLEMSSFFSVVREVKRRQAKPWTS